MLKKVMLTAVVCCSAALAFANEISWGTNKGTAAQAPALTVVEVDGIGKIYRGEAVADGTYQGMTLKFAKPVDLSKYAGFEIQVSHNLSKSRMGLVCRLEQKPVSAYTVAVLEVPERTKVYVPFEVAKFTGNDGKTAKFTTVHEICFYPYEAWSKTGEYFEFDSFRFVPKSEAAK